MPGDVRAIRREHIEAYIEHLAREGIGRKGRVGLRPASLSLAYRSIRPFWKWLVEEDEIERSPMERMKPPIVPVEAPPIIREEQMVALLKACEGTTFEQRRDMALLRLLYDTGMRRGECANLKVDDIDWERDVVTVFGKGRRSARARSASRRRRRSTDTSDSGHAVPMAMSRGSGSAGAAGSWTRAFSRSSAGEAVRPDSASSILICSGTRSRTKC